MYVCVSECHTGFEIKQSDFEALSPHNWRTGGPTLIKFYIVVSSPYLSVK